MPTTSLGLTYPASTGHTRLWEHLQTLAQNVNDLFVAKTPLMGTGQLTSAYTMTATMTDLAGASVTLNVPRAGASALIVWSTDMQVQTTGSVTAYTLVNIDGVDQPQNAVWNPGGAAVGGRVTVGNSFTTTLATSGSHTFKLRGVGTSAIKALNIHTQISVVVLP